MSKVFMISVGAFGMAVGRYVRRLYPNIHEMTRGDISVTDGRHWPAFDLVILAASRPAPRLCERLDEISQRRRAPFIPLLVESGALRLGPVIVPGDSGCWRCWERRSQQHCAYPQERSALLEWYDAHPQVGPRGYLEAFAVIGAARIAQTITEVNRSAGSAAGTIWQLHMFTSKVSTGLLLGIDGCPICGLNRGLTTRTYLEMQQSLKEMWRNGTRTETAS